MEIKQYVSVVLCFVDCKIILPCTIRVHVPIFLEYCNYIPKKGTCG